MQCEKQSPELENGTKSPARKKARTTNSRRNVPEAHSTNLMFRKFVGNALNEKAAVGILYAVVFVRESKMSLMINDRETQQTSNCSEESSQPTLARNQHRLPMNYR